MKFSHLLLPLPRDGELNIPPKTNKQTNKTFATPVFGDGQKNLPQIKFPNFSTVPLSSLSKKQLIALGYILRDGIKHV